VDMYTTPILTARDAARHLRMPESTLDVWIAKQRAAAPLIHSVTPERRGWPRLPFVAVIEAYVLRSLRDLGATMDEIRQTAAFVREEFGDEYALASKRIASDGVDLFVELAETRQLFSVKHNQYGIREVLSQYLQYVTWDDEGKPKRLRLQQYPEGAAVVIDPRFGWGSPVLEHSKVPVDAMLALWKAGDPMSVVAEEFDLPVDVVEDVLRAAAA
jgi:uncharacterized protein (DUF433 family)